MGPIDWIVMGVVLLIIGAAVFYIVRAKRRGQKCIGCPDGSKCSGNCSACTGCSSQRKNGDT